jgi:hypothetical protein
MNKPNKTLGSNVPRFANKSKQRGIALLILGVILALAGSMYVLQQLDAKALKVERDKKTAAALAQAKTALIGYAAGVDLPNTSCAPVASNNCVRLGDLPCPDTNNDGIAEPSCGNAVGTTGQSSRLGRLPWKTLKINDVRDGNGERLWYAVSNNFKYNTRTTCNSPGGVGCLNSDTTGTITFRDTSGTVTKNASIGNGIVAVIISPGAPITRNDSIVQERACSGCDLLAINYLDNLTSSSDDNASFVDSSATDGFIQGPIFNASGGTIINDTILTITTEEVIPLLEKRVAGEVLNCLKNYASSPHQTITQGRHPWAVSPSAYPSFIDSSSNVRVGRIPDTAFSRTVTDGSGNMPGAWPGSCKIFSASGWWLNWKELVFYGVGYDRDPSNGAIPPCGDSLNDCLTIVTSTGNQTNKSVAVIVAGKILSGQNRSVKTNISNYLEGENRTTVTGVNPDGGDAWFVQAKASSSFNDIVVYY